MANTVMKLANTGIMSSGAIDEVTLNPSSQGSLYFGGSSYINPTATSSNYTCAGDFTVECWVLLQTVAAVQTNIFQLGTETTGRYVFYHNNGILYGNLFGGSAVAFGGTLTADRWYHIALVRSGSTISCYLNGTALGTTQTLASTVGNGQVYIAADATGGNKLSGSISNFRFVNGTAVYTSNFNIMSLIPLTAIPNTVLLLNTPYSNDRLIDTGPNAVSIANTGAVTNYALHPFISKGIDLYSSAYFPGGVDYLSVSSTGATGMSTLNFTIEMWIYPTNLAVTPQYLYDQRPTTASAVAPTLYIASSILLYMTQNTTRITGPTLVNNTWYHIAISRISNVTKMFVNGVMYGPYTDAGTYVGATANRPLIGISADVLTGSFNGYISNVRTTRGTGFYTDTFTPSTTALTAVANTTLLVAQSSSPTVDNSLSPLTITNVGGVTATNAVIPFATTYSNQFNGTSQYLSLPVSSFIPVINNTYTIEFWIYPTAYPAATTQTSIYQINNNNVSNFGGLNLEFMAAGTIRLEVRPSTGGGNVQVSSPTVLSLNTWTHVAVSCNNGRAVIYINGVATVGGTVVALDGTQTFSSIGFLNNGYVTSQAYFSGYISNLRIVKGTLYNQLTPPSTPYKASPNTQLLTCQSSTIRDNSSTGLPLATVGKVITTANNIPTSIYASNQPVSRQYANGVLQTTGILDEVTLNNNLIGSISATTTQYITAPVGPYCALGTDDFTIEGWVFLTQSVVSAGIIGSWTGTAATSSWVLQQNATAANTLTFSVSDGTTITQFDGTNGLPRVNQWIHIAAVRSSNTLTLYSNGTAVYSGAAGAFTTNLSVSSQFLQINGYGGLTNMSSGNFSNFRITRGQAVYTGAFTPPTTRLQVIQPAGTNIAAITDPTRVKLLLNSYRQSYEDGSIYNNTLSSIGTPVATYMSPYYQPAAGYYSVGFNNINTSYLSIPYNAGFSIPAGQAFCIEFWTYMTAATAAAAFCGWNWSYGSGGPTWGIQTDPNGMWPQLGISGSGQGGTFYYFARSSAYTIPLNQWTHVVISRDSTGAARSFINGIMNAYYFTALTTGSGQAFTAASGAMYFGQVVNGAAPAFPGMISNFKFVNGNVPTAYATSNTTINSSIFTPPTSPATNEANTKFIVCQSSSFIDTSSIGSTVTAAGTVNISTASPFIPSTTPTISTNTIVRKQYSNGNIQMINAFNDTLI